MTAEEQVMELVERYGAIDGAHHKQWVLDQIARVIKGAGYEQWVTDDWDEGIAP